MYVKADKDFEKWSIIPAFVMTDLRYQPTKISSSAWLRGLLPTKIPMTCPVVISRRDTILPIIPTFQTWTNIDAYLYGADVRAILDIVPDFSVEAAAVFQRGKKDSQPNNNNDRDLAQISPLKSKLAFHYDHADFFGIPEWIHSEYADDIDS